MTPISKQEILDLYAEAIMTFDHYYKYTFAFKGEMDGANIMINFGGNAEDIYRQEVTNKPVLLKSLPFDYASITKEGKQMEYYDFK